MPGRKSTPSADYYAYSRELVNGDSIFDFDVTKLSIHTLDIGLAGIEVYDLLRDEYDIQMEFGDLGNILAYVSIGDRIAGRGAAGQRPCRRSAAASSRDKAGMLEPGIYRAHRWPPPPRRPFMRKRNLCRSERKRGPGMQRICHVLSAGNPHSGSGRTDYSGKNIIDYYMMLLPRKKAALMTGQPEDCQMSV